MIAYNSGTDIIEVTGFTELVPCDFDTIYNEDKTAIDGRQLLNGSISGNPDTFSLDNQPCSADDLALILKLSCTPRVGATVSISGTDKDDNSIQDNGIDISSGTALSVLKFKTIDINGITVNGLTIGDDFDIWQDRWGVISKEGDSQYKIDCKINLGNGVDDTWFKDIKKQVEFHNSVYYFAEAHMQFGDVVDINLKTVNNGCMLQFINGGFYGSSLYKPNNPVYFYDSTVLQPNNPAFAWLSSGGRFWGCILEMYPGNVEPPNVADFINTISRDMNYGNSRCPVTADNWQIINPTTYGVYFAGSDTATMRNVRIINAPIDVRCRVFRGTVHMIDCECGWIVSWKRTCSGSVYQQYSFNLKTEPEAIVKIWQRGTDNNFTDGDIFYSGVVDINGNLPEQILTYFRHVKGTGDVQYYHQIEIVKSGYQIYKKQFVLDEKIDWQIYLKPARVQVDQECLA